MKSKKNKLSENYLEKIPFKKEGLEWRIEEDNKVVILMENKGVFNHIAQVLFKKPAVTQIHLDDIGSFVWPLIDGEKNIIQLGVLLDERFGKSAKPLYERLAKFFQILELHKFIVFK